LSPLPYSSRLILLLLSSLVSWPPDTLYHNILTETWKVQSKFIYTFIPWRWDSCCAEQLCSFGYEPWVHYMKRIWINI
jgi:hypothetical protein